MTRSERFTGPGGNGPGWGQYAPSPRSWFLRRLIALGLSRGALRRKVILPVWQRRFGPIADVTVRGIRYRLDIRDNLNDRKLLASSAEIDRVELRALENHCRGKVFVDIGANIGYYSLALARNGARRVIAIEPNPPVLGRLLYNVSINGLEGKTTVLPVGIGTEGAAELYFSDRSLDCASVLKDLAGEGSRSVSITVRPLLDVLAELGIERIGGLKIDIEGIEDRALEPFFRDAPKALWPDCIVIEHANRAAWDTDIIASLLESGYRTLHETRLNTVLLRSPVPPGRAPLRRREQNS